MNAPAPSPRPPALLRVANAVGLGRGLFKRPEAAAPPRQLLELYSMEGCHSCRRVRQLLTELEIDYVHRSCPKGDSHNRRQLERRGGKVQVPYLVDPNYELELYESADIIGHLLARYAGAR